MNILEMMDKYDLELTKQGDLYITFCPFHRDENRPNFTIYEKTDSWFCYTCSDGGDPIKFLAKMENISRAEATQRIYSDLRYLIDKINKVPVASPYNDTIAIQAAKKFRAFVYDYPERLDQVKPIMKEFDNQLGRNLDRTESIAIMDKITTQLNTLAARV